MTGLRNKVLFSLGNRIRYLRGERGWSQEELAGEAGLDRTYVGGIERGERNVAIMNLARIAKALDISLAEMFKSVVL